MNPDFPTDRIEAFRESLPQVQKQFGPMGTLSHATVQWTFLCTAAMSGPLSQAQGAGLSAGESWRVSTEVLGFLTVLASRIASSFGEQIQKRLMDDLVASVVPVIVQYSWPPTPGAAQAGEHAEFQRRMTNETFENLYVASRDYAGCTSIDGGGPEHWLETETLVGVLGRAISQALGAELDPMTRFMLSRIVSEPILFGPVDLNLVRLVQDAAAALGGRP